MDPILDISTFVPPNLNQDSSGEELPRVVVEFCDRCRWCVDFLAASSSISPVPTQASPRHLDADRGGLLPALARRALISDLLPSSS